MDVNIIQITYVASATEVLLVNTLTGTGGGGRISSVLSPAATTTTSSSTAASSSTTVARTSPDFAFFFSRWRADDRVGVSSCADDGPRVLVRFDDDPDRVPAISVGNNTRAANDMWCCVVDVRWGGWVGVMCHYEDVSYCNRTRDESKRVRVKRYFCGVFQYRESFS